MRKGLFIYLFYEAVINASFVIHFNYSSFLIESDPIMSWQLV